MPAWKIHYANWVRTNWISLSSTPSRHIYTTRPATALLREMEKGKSRYLEITETLPNNPAGVMLRYHMMHQVARRITFSGTVEGGIATVLMFLLRSIFSILGRLEETIAALAAAEKVPNWLNKDVLRDFLIHHEGGAKSVIDAAKRYGGHERGNDVILFGRGVTDQIRSNITSIFCPPLPPLPALSPRT